METTNDNLIDKQLYISMQQGNKKAFDTLFIKYYAMLCAFARSFVSLEDAEEVVQDTMLQIWENRKTNHIDSSVHHYLFKAVKNKCYTLMTRNSLRFQIENILTPDIQELFEDPDFYIIEELTQKIEKAILNLPESYRVAFEMHRFQNKTYQEIAEELNISSKTVDYRIQQALKQLRKELKDYLKESILSAKPGFRSASAVYEAWKRMGYTQDPAIDKMKKIETLKFEDIIDFYNENIKGKPVVIAIVGNPKDFDTKALEKYGKVVKVSESKLFSDSF